MVRRSDFRLTVWLVAYASLAVSSIVLGDFSTLLCSARNDRGGRRQTVRLQTSGKRCFMHDKNTDGYPCQSVLRASQNQASTLDCRKGTPCSNPELVVRECGLMLQGMVSVFLFDCLAFYESAEFVPIFPGKSGRKIRSLYRDSWRPFC